MGRRIRKSFVAAAMAALVLSASAPAFADEYDPEEAGHPLRIVAYALHPVGVLLSTLIFRPAHWVVSHEPWATIFGHEES